MIGRRVGIVGTGFIATKHAAAWKVIGAPPAAFLYAEPGITHLQRYQAEFFTELEPFLDAVDLVDICVPTDLHPQFALAAAQAGRSTICEKPLSLTVEEGIQVIEAFDRSNALFIVGHQLRFSPEYAAAREAIMAGKIGDPAVLRFSRLSFAPRRPAGSWFADPNKSGGILFDLMIHDLDLARWIAGDVVTVYARCSPGGPGHAIAILKHASGAISHLEASWSEPAPVFRTSFEIAGSKGMISYSSADTVPLSARLHVQGEAANTGLGSLDLAANPFELELRHFLDLVDKRIKPVLTARDGLLAVQLAVAARESVATGREVAISPLPEAS